MVMIRLHLAMNRVSRTPDAQCPSATAVCMGESTQRSAMSGRGSFGPAPRWFPTSSQLNTWAPLALARPVPSPAFLRFAFSPRQGPPVDANPCLRYSPGPVAVHRTCWSFLLRSIGPSAVGFMVAVPRSVMLRWSPAAEAGQCGICQVGMRMCSTPALHSSHVSTRQEPKLLPAAPVRLPHTCHDSRRRSFEHRMLPPWLAVRPSDPIVAGSAPAVPRLGCLRGCVNSLRGPDRFIIGDPRS